MRILLVDDDASVTPALLAILKTLPGHEVRSAASGEEALGAAAELGGVDLLITDVVMEPMDGFTLRDQMIAQFPTVRTILISGYDLTDYPEQTQHHQLLGKPIDAETLRAAVARELPPAPTPEPVPEPPAAPVAVPVPVAAVPVPATPVAVPVAAVPVARPTVVAKAVPVPAAAQPAVKAQPTVVAKAVPAPAAQPVARPQAVPASGVRAVPVAGPTPAPVAKPAVPVASPNQPAVTMKATAVPRPSAVSPSPAAPSTAAPTPVHQPTVRVAATMKAQPVPMPSAPSAVPKAASAVVPVPVARPSAVATPAPRSGAVQTKAVTPAPAPKSAVALPTVVATAVPMPGSSVRPLAFSAPAIATSGEDLSGQMLGVYQIQRKLGEGRWGGIYAGLQTSINRPVSLEVLDMAKAADPVTQGRFVADARAKAGVQHPSILAVYEAGEADGRFFYAYEFVDGQSLAELKNSGQRLDEPAALKVLRTVADGLAYFNTQHSPHSTPDAAGVFVGADGNPRLANVATQLSDEQLAPPQEIQALGRILLSVLPAIQSLSPGLRELLKRMVQPGPQALSSWGNLLQSIKAIEPKVVPLEASKISAHDRAAIAAVELARKQQKRSLYYNIASLVTLVALIGGFVWWFFGTNERTLDEMVEIPAGDFLFANGQVKNLPVFWIDKHEVTYGQYAKFVQFLEGHPTTEYDHPQQPRSKSAMMHKPEHWEIYYTRAKAGAPVHSTPIDLNCPVMEVDFWDAYAYAKWKGHELPTEEEWEKAARGTKGRNYPWGDEFDPKKVNSNADYDADHPDAKGKIDGFNFWNPVDKIKGDKSEFGVIGMAGNVREWTGTWDTAKRKPIVKGGSFMSSDVTLTQRADNIDPSAISEAIGFRTVSHTPPPAKK